jgi:hypothetical protein
MQTEHEQSQACIAHKSEIIRVAGVPTAEEQDLLPPDNLIVGHYVNKVQTLKCPSLESLICLVFTRFVKKYLAYLM